MIFYFTGTGNSLSVAKALGALLDESLISIAEALRGDAETLTYPLRPEERVLFVFPIHSWGPAVLMLRFIERLRLSGYQGQSVYSVCTCGDDCGYANAKMRKALLKRGLTLTYSFSVQMPNNYILLPGFDVDAPEVERRKLEQAPVRVAAIVEAIRSGKAAVELYHPGSLASLKSGLIYPLFVHFAMRSKSFRVTSSCTSCGVCAKLCPTGTITLSEKKLPVWAAEGCVQCLACIHRCPVRAIEYGTVSEKKGRYSYARRINQ
ncbi:MAG: EFR1 family ferrodoxin [Tannerellaceae bacterium]